MKRMEWMASLAAVAVLGGTLVARPAYASSTTEDAGKRIVTLQPASAPADSAEDGTQADDHLFDAIDKLGAKAKSSNEVNLDKSMLGLAARKGGEKGDLAQKLDYIVVRNYEFAHENEYNIDDLKPIFKRLDESGWKHLVRTRENREMTDICIRQDNEGVTKEMVIISAEPKEISLVHLKGNVTLADMKNFGGLMRSETKGDAPNKDDLKLNHH
ncbi:DUF4252 domain-containing protein [Terriglobus aquaticus]|uniref:DUF4252 domain-containing protein n=1 Tax=Terriglobus aquaticus TaxID=940139 RepID=A0ABW9KMT6_9BACT|nr:DUF4252 domain-containing protein [Terriglobus aquaticus]